MAKFQLSRRKFLTAASLGTSGLLLSGCDAFDGHLGMGDGLRSFLEGANDLTHRAQRLLTRDALAPEFSEADIRQMLGELKGSALLAGVRGRPGGDPAAVAGAVLALTRITRAWRPDWASVEINPLWVHGTTVEAWDALVIPQPVEETTSAPISGAGGSE